MTAVQKNKRQLKKVAGRKPVPKSTGRGRLPWQNRELPDLLRVVVVQMTSTDDVAANVAAILRFLKGQIGRGVDLILFPENCLFLRTNTASRIVTTFNLKEKFWGDLQAVVDRGGFSVLLGSVQVKSAAKPTNSIVMLRPSGRPEVVYSKVHLFDVDVVGAPPSRESDHFQHGPSGAVAQVRGWKVGLSICYDVRFSELYLKYAKQGVQIMVVPAAFLVPTGQAHWHTLLRARAIEGQAYVLAAAQSGGHVGTDGSRRETFGHSLIIDPWGRVVAEATESGPSVLTADLSLGEIEKVRGQIPMAGHRRIK